MFRTIIIFFITFCTAVCISAYDLNFSRYFNTISPQLIIDYFKKSNLNIQIDNKNLSEKYIKELYKYLRTYLNNTYFKSPPPFGRILKIVVTFNENTQKFDFESYFTEKKINSDVVYV